MSSRVTKMDTFCFAKGHWYKYEDMNTISQQPLMNAASQITWSAHLEISALAISSAQFVL